jgi:atypical dual specificity phosphatase
VVLLSVALAIIIIGIGILLIGLIRRGSGSGVSEEPIDMTRFRQTAEPAELPFIAPPAVPSEAPGEAFVFRRDTSASPADIRSLEETLRKPKLSDTFEHESSEPAANEPFAFEPVAAPPVTAEPVALASIFRHEPVFLEPEAAEPVVSEPVTHTLVFPQEPVLREPITLDPVDAEPAPPETVIFAPATPAPVFIEPIADAPAALEPVAAEPVAPEAIIAEPVPPAPVFVEPAAEATATIEPVAAAPAVSEPAALAPEPAALTPVAAEPEFGGKLTSRFSVIQPVEAAPPIQAEAAPPSPLLVSDGYGVGFGDKIILADVSFDVPATGITSLMGPAGTGKSTLLRSLAGLYAQNALYKSWGQVRYRGAPLSPENRPALVAQRIQLTQCLVLENLVFHVGERIDLSDEQQREWATNWLQDAGVGELIQVLDKPFLELPSVSQRMVTILREAAAQTPLLMIDEPTSGLSDADADSILRLLQTLGKKISLLVVLHNQKQAREISQKIVLLAGGRIQGEANTQDFFNTTINPVVTQFVATGSCSVPAPDFPAEFLADNVAPPLPLSEGARAATQTHEAAAPVVAEPVAQEVASPIVEVRAAPAAEETAPPVAQELPSPAIQQPSIPTPPEPVVTLPVAAPPVVIEAPAYTPPPVIEHPVVPVRRFVASSAAGPRGFVWIEEGRLAATPQPGVAHDVDYDLDLLKRVGITTLITLTENNFPQDALARHGLENFHLAIPDRKAPTAAEMDLLVTRMRELLAEGKVLAVHCLAGLGRTGTIIAALMVKEKGITAQAALDQIRKVNRQFVQSDDQEDFLVEYEVQHEQVILKDQVLAHGTDESTP